MERRPADSGAVLPAVTVRGGPVPGCDLERLGASIAAAARLIGVPVARVDLLVADDAAMDRFHRRYAGIPGTTDVLTFPASAPGEPIEVDMVAGHDEAARRAAELGHPVERELLLYALHGLLHCAGHDDHDPDAYDRMHTAEDRILTELGVGPVFRTAGSGCSRTSVASEPRA
jgi:probable rRNA maturation factor